MNAWSAHRLFCYGTLEFPQIMRSVAGRLFPAAPAVLSGYRRHAIKGEVFPGIAPHPGAEVAGTLYYGLSRGHLRQLDAYEAVLYRRRRLRLRDAEGRLCTAWSYVVAEMCRHRLDASDWDRDAFASRYFACYLRRLHA